MVKVVWLAAQGAPQVERLGQVAVFGLRQFRPARAAGTSIRLGFRDAPAGHPLILDHVLTEEDMGQEEYPLNAVQGFGVPS